MEQVQNLFREGVMSHLDRLEALSQNLAHKQEQKRQQEIDLQEKRDLIVRLQEERDDLRSQIQLQKETIQSLSERKEESEPNVQSTLQDLRLEEIRSIMEALWFTGISGKLKDSGACFCITVAFEGTYLDSYYIQVNNLKKPQITRHSIPPFIPLSHLANEHLPDNLKKLLHVLFEQLNGYAGRKFQADQLEKKSPKYVKGSLQKNSLHTVLSFSYNIPIEGQIVSFAAKLIYGDITSTFPTEVKVTCSDDKASMQEMISSHVSAFSSTALHRALDSFTT